MKKILICLLLIAGCSTVSPEQKKDIKIMSVRIAVLNSRCQRGEYIACQQCSQMADETMKMIIDFIDPDFERNPK